MIVGKELDRKSQDTKKASKRIGFSAGAPKPVGYSNRWEIQEMNTVIDANVDFRSDTQTNRDPDAYSKTLKISRVAVA